MPMASAACSAEERREAEAELRERLEREGMTDEQRRLHDKLWERLRTTEEAFDVLLGDVRGPLLPTDDEISQGAWWDPGHVLRLCIQHIVVAGPEEARPLIEWLAGLYRETRQEVQAVIGEARDRWRMTDEQQQRLEEVRQRLDAAISQSREAGDPGSSTGGPPYLFGLGTAPHLEAWQSLEDDEE